MTTPWTGFEHKPLDQQWLEAAGVRPAPSAVTNKESSPSAPLPKKPSVERAKQMAAAKADGAERARQLGAAMKVAGVERAKQIADERGWVSAQTK